MGRRLKTPPRKSRLVMARNYSSVHGAQALAAAIKRYWAARGYDVSVWCVSNLRADATNGSITGVRSDMVNGFPVRRLPKSNRGGGS